MVRFDDDSAAFLSVDNDNGGCARIILKTLITSSLLFVDLTLLFFSVFVAGRMTDDFANRASTPGTATLTGVDDFYSYDADRLVLLDADGREI
jgi:hypothetical protein